MRMTRAEHRKVASWYRSVLLAVFSVVIVGGVGVAFAAIPTGNLIRNAGAEEGTASAGGVDDIDVPKWRDTGKFTAVQYGAPGFPTDADSSSIGGGSDFFAGGPDGAKNTASQKIALPSSANAEIDSGAVTAQLSGYLGGFAGQADNMVVQAIFKSASNSTLGQFKIGPVTPADRAGATKLLKRTQSAAVPASTRAIVVKQIATRLSGTYNDGYADKLSLRLTTP